MFSSNINLKRAEIRVKAIKHNPEQNEALYPSKDLLVVSPCVHLVMPKVRCSAETQVGLKSEGLFGLTDDSVKTRWFAKVSCSFACSRHIEEV